MDILSSIDKLVDQEYGLVQSFYCVEAPINLPPMYRYIADVKISNNNYDLCGYGYSFFESDAKRRALGEGVERYCGAMYNPHSVYDTEKNISLLTEYVSPKKFYIDKMITSKNYCFKTKIHWTKVQNAVIKNDAYIPSFFINCPPIFDKEYFPADSAQTTGLAAGTTFESAAFRGVLECVERDAFARYWVNNLKLFSLNKKIYNTINRHIINNYKAIGLSIDIFRIETDYNIPCYCARILNKNYNVNDMPLNYISIKAGFDFHRTIFGLLGELVGGFYSLYEMIKSKDYSEYIDVNDIKFNYEHAIYYCNKNIPLHNIVNEDSEYITNDNYTFDRVVKELHDWGIKVYFVDISCEDVSSLGIHVVKVISPDLCYLFHSFDNYNHKRLQSNKKNIPLHPFA